MNTKSASFIAAAFFITAASFAVAGPGPNNWQTLRQPDQFAKLKPGEKIAYVCNECKTVTVATVESTAQAMDHCKEGATVTCPSCKTKVKVALKGAPKFGRVEREVVYTNDKGQECLFIAKVSAKP